MTINYCKLQRLYIRKQCLGVYAQGWDVVVVEGHAGKHFALDVGHIVGPLNYSQCDTKHRLPCTITPFY